MAWLRRHRGLIPYLLLAPGMLWLTIFYVYPAFQMFLASLSTRTGEIGFEFSGQISNYLDGLADLRGPVHPVDRLRPGGDDRGLPHRLSPGLHDRLPGRAAGRT